MTFADLIPVAVSGIIAVGMYLYLLNERRKLRASRDHTAQPAE